MTFQEVQNLIDKLRRDFENASNQDRLIREVEKTSEDTCHKLFQAHKAEVILETQKEASKTAKEQSATTCKILVPDLLQEKCWLYIKSIMKEDGQLAQAYDTYLNDIKIIQTDTKKNLLSCSNMAGEDFKMR